MYFIYCMLWLPPFHNFVILNYFLLFVFILFFLLSQQWHRWDPDCAPLLLWPGFCPLGWSKLFGGLGSFVGCSFPSSRTPELVGGRRDSVFGSHCTGHAHQPCISPSWLLWCMQTCCKPYPWQFWLRSRAACKWSCRAPFLFRHQCTPCTMNSTMPDTWCHFWVSGKCPPGQWTLLD